jgi:hypothetical protein
MDFASDALWTGRRFRCLCRVGHATRESPALLADFSIGGTRVLRVLDELAARHGLIVMDNGPEFTGRALLAWSARTGVRLRFIQPGKRIQNAFVESFIGRFWGRLPEPALVRRARRGRAGDRGLAAAPQSRAAAQRGSTMSRPSGSRARSARLDSMKVRAPRRRSLRRSAPCYDVNGSPPPWPNFGGRGHTPHIIVWCQQVPPAASPPAAANARACKPHATLRR